MYGFEVVKHYKSTEMLCEAKVNEEQLDNHT